MKPINSNFDYKRRLYFQIILKWIFLFGLIISVIANFLQLTDRIHQQNRINSLQLISGNTDNKIQSSDTATDKGRGGEK